MASYIDQELESRGVSQVIVIMGSEPNEVALRTAKRALAGTANAANLKGEVSSLAANFISSELSQTSQLRRAFAPGAARYAAGKRGRRAQGRASAVPSARYYPHLGVMLGTVDRAGLAALRKDPRVKDVVGAPPLRLIRPRRVAAAANPNAYTWGLTALKVPTLHSQGLTGKGILVGHLDTGADGRHPALRKAIEGFAEFDDFGRETSPSPRPYDTDEHGTHTAATIAGRPVRRSAVGVAPGAGLYSAIVIEGGDVVARVLGGMDWALGNSVRILSMSLGFPGWWAEFQGLTRLLRSRNVLPVFAVGNEGPGTSRSPGNYPEALSVGASDYRGNVADFSSSQRFRRENDPIVPDLVGPGVDVVSAKPGGGWQSMDGTSMATPHLAGLAALLMEAKPDKSAAEVEAAIFRSCTRRPGAPVGRVNRGFPDAVQALGLL